MSKRNTLAAKRVRRAEREAKAEGLIDRQIASKRAFEIPAVTETTEDGAEVEIQPAQSFVLPNRRERRGRA